MYRPAFGQSAIHSSKARVSKRTSGESPVSNPNLIITPEVAQGALTK